MRSDMTVQSRSVYSSRAAEGKLARSELRKGKGVDLFVYLKWPNLQANLQKTNSWAKTVTGVGSGGLSFPALKSSGGALLCAAGLPSCCVEELHWASATNNVQHPHRLRHPHSPSVSASCLRLASTHNVDYHSRLQGPSIPRRDRRRGKHAVTDGGIGAGGLTWT